MQDSHLIETRLSSEEIFQGHFLHAFRDRVSLPDGSSAVREYVRHPGAAMVIALLEDAHRGTLVVLERQYRHPVAQVMIEFPAGKLDKNEDGLCCAQRELREETGYQAKEWARAGVLHPVISYSTEYIEVWFARGLTAGPPSLDQGEFLEVFTATPSEVLDWCFEGKITDSKTLTAALWLQNVLSGKWPLEWRIMNS
ncbi:MAG: NUDIX domain-containing protein [Hylemonella sp.]